MTGKRMKTVRVNATMYTYLSTTINVPADTDPCELRRLVRDYMDGGDLKADDFGDWEWGDIDEVAFDPEADDYTPFIGKPSIPIGKHIPINTHFQGDTNE